MAKCDDCKYYNRPNDPEWIRLHDRFNCIYLGEPRISHASCGNFQPSNESFLKQRIAELEAELKEANGLCSTAANEIVRLGSDIAEKDRMIEALAAHDTNCPPEPVVCRRKIDTPSDTYESCIECRKEWAQAKAKEAE